MANIMVTNVNGSGDDVCLFSEEEISADIVRRGLSSLGFKFDDVYPVRGSELEFYIYEPLWLNAKQLATLRAAADLKVEQSKS